MSLYYLLSLMSSPSVIRRSAESGYRILHQPSATCINLLLPAKHIIHFPFSFVSSHHPYHGSC